MKNELGKKGIDAIIVALASENVNPPMELTIEILKEIYKTRVGAIIDGQTKVFSHEKFEQTLLEMENLLKPQEVFVPTKLNEPIKVDGKRKSKVKE